MPTITSIKFVNPIMGSQTKTAEAMRRQKNTVASGESQTDGIDPIERVRLWGN